MPPKQSNADEVIDLTTDDGPPTSTPVHVSDDDDNDEDLKLAIALSLQHQSEIVATNRFSAADEHGSPDISSSREDVSLQQEHKDVPVECETSSSRSGLLALDRKQMEVERLARLKRKRNASQTTDIAMLPPDPSQGRGPTPQPTTSAQATVVPKTQDDKRKRSAKENTTLAHRGNTFEFPQGTVLLTTTDTSRLKSSGSTSLPQLLEPTDDNLPLKSALLSTFTADFDWLFPHFDTKTVSFILVLHAANSQHKRNLEHDFYGIRNVKLVFPHVGGIVNCMHSKLMLLFYESGTKTQTGPLTLNRCRVVVPTANLTPYDWGVGNIMENAIFVIDLPETTSTKTEAKTTVSPTRTRTPFQDNLLSLLRSMRVPEAVISKLDKYDFSATQDIGFVHTIGGSHMLQLTDSPKTSHLPGSDRTGLVCLAEVVKSLGFAETQDGIDSHLRLDYITSSLGNLKPRFLSSLCAAASGQIEWLSSSLEGHSSYKNRIPQSAGKTVAGSCDDKASVRVYFPSNHTVKNSGGGPPAAGTICFSSKRWDSETRYDFPKHILRDCVGVRNDGVLMHSKILYATFSYPQRRRRDIGSFTPRMDDAAEEHENTLYVGWVYIGSANLSESAWGTTLVDTKTKISKLNCGNWESGIVIPISLSERVRRELETGKTLHELTLRDVFGDAMPVPIKEPAETYDDGRRPWFFDG